MDIHRECFSISGSSTLLAQKVMTEMITKAIYKEALQEATDVLNRYQSSTPKVQRWSCEVCGMIHSGAEPSSCDSCGAADVFASQQDMRNEIGSRW